jgi:hypothetical protein
MRRNNSDKEMCQDYFKYDAIPELSTSAAKYFSPLCSARPSRQLNFFLNFSSWTD